MSRGITTFLTEAAIRLCLLSEQKYYSIHVYSVTNLSECPSMKAHVLYIKQQRGRGFQMALSMLVPFEVTSLSFQKNHFFHL